MHLRKIEPPCKLLELDLTCLICVHSVRPFKTLTASAYFNLFNRIEENRSGGRNFIFEDRWFFDIFFKYYHASYCECLKKVMEKMKLSIRQETQSRQQSTKESTDFH